MRCGSCWPSACTARWGRETSRFVRPARRPSLNWCLNRTHPILFLNYHCNHFTVKPTGSDVVFIRKCMQSSIPSGSILRCSLRAHLAIAAHRGCPSHLRTWLFGTRSRHLKKALTIIGMNTSLPKRVRRSVRPNMEGKRVEGVIWIPDGGDSKNLER